MLSWTFKKCFEILFSYGKLEFAGAKQFWLRGKIIVKEFFANYLCAANKLSMNSCYFGCVAQDSSPFKHEL